MNFLKIKASSFLLSPSTFHSFIDRIFSNQALLKFLRNSFFTSAELTFYQRSRSGPRQHFYSTSRPRKNSLLKPKSKNHLHTHFYPPHPHTQIQDQDFGLLVTLFKNNITTPHSYINTIFIKTQDQKLLFQSSNQPQPLPTNTTKPP